MKYVLIVILTALIVGLGVVAYFKGWLPTVSFNKPQAVSTQNMEVISTPTEIPVMSPSASPSESFTTQDILNAVKAALIAKHGSDFSSLNYTLSKVEGNYASGSVSGSGGGGMWFAANVGGSWVIVSDGNGTTLCSDLTPYPSFPKDMIPECWDSSTNKLITR